MSQPELSVLAEGDLPAGHRWVLRAGGNHADFATFLETIYPDGRRDEGGMAGPPLYPGSLMNTYTGGTGRGLRRVLVRADPRVTRIRLHLVNGERLDLAPVAALSDPGLTFFVALLPQTVGLVSVNAVDAGGEEVEVRDLSAHETFWQHFLARRPPNH